MELLITAQTALLVVVAIALGYLIVLVRIEVRGFTKTLAAVRMKLENTEDFNKRIAELEARLTPD